MPIPEKQSEEAKPPFVNSQIKFVLEVTATIPGKRGVTDTSPIDITLNLNPDNSIVYIEQSLSTRRDLLKIFERLEGLITRLDKRADLYAGAIKIDKNALGSFSDEVKKGVYEQNFKPSFEKIDRIIHIERSPGRSSVSYTSSYNGDIPPSKKGGPQ